MSRRLRWSGRVPTGSVRGFAFTLGLSTLLDLLVVFLFTKPVVMLLVRHPLFSTSRFSGLSSHALLRRRADDVSAGSAVWR